MTDPEFVELFRGEATERLDSMVRLLLELETGSGGTEAVDALFREAHSLKGGASMVGLDDLCRIAHAAEDVLEVARDEGTLAPALVEPLLAAVDAMRGQLDGDPADEPTVLAALAAAANGHRSAPDLAPPPEESPAPAANGSEPTPERRAIRVAPEKSTTCSTSSARASCTGAASSTRSARTAPTAAAGSPTSSTADSACSAI